ncbi:MAG: hypothetical protein PHD55_08930 [Methanoregula sp.]|jgi:hypothetical protein|nr:hypothetical protein [Methanoregula sp.]
MNRTPFPSGTPGLKKTNSVHRDTLPADDMWLVLVPYAIRAIDPVLAAWALARTDGAV